MKYILLHPKSRHANIDRRRKTTSDKERRQAQVGNKERRQAQVGKDYGER
jgi:hypothetical protein